MYPPSISSEANDAVLALLRFAAAELLEEWLSAADIQDPDLGLRAWHIVARASSRSCFVIVTDFRPRESSTSV